MNREHRFEGIVNRGAAEAVRADQALMVATADPPTECIVIATRNATPPVPASTGDQPAENEKTCGDHEGHRGFDLGGRRRRQSDGSPHPLPCLRQTQP
jgi:hypothetical protein